MAGRFNKLWEQIKKQALKDYDAIFGKKYKVWIINSESDVSLYLWDNWKHLYPEFDALLKLVSNPAYIRTFQSFEFENEWLGFGRMKWDEKNNIKWTSKYRTAEYRDKKLLFFGTEIWAPDWNYCYKNGVNPEVFIKLYYDPKPIRLKEGILIAIPKRITRKNGELVCSSIEAIQKTIPNSTLSTFERYWTPSKDFHNRIEDMNHQELEKLLVGKVKK